MGIGRRIRNLRIDSGMTQKELSNYTGVSTITISNWEQEAKLPSAPAIISLSNIFKVTSDYILGINNNINLSHEEMSILDSYRKSDKYGKEAIRSISQIEKSRSESTCNNHNSINITKYRSIPYYDIPSVAGYSTPIDESTFTMIQVTDDTPRNSDMAIRIQGTSMMPYIYDGETVFVHKQESVEIGDIGIFCVNGAMYCKQYILCEDKVLVLASLNEELKWSNVIIKPDGCDSIKCIGKVINKSAKIPGYIKKDYLLYNGN